HNYATALPCLHKNFITLLDRIAEAENQRISSKEPNPFHTFPKANTKERKSKSGQSKAGNSSVDGTSSVTAGKEE
ncbi:hypothetical protein, partial [Succinimonas amylolytica]|uniref:hypothetical protein n=1 Tax=Succinimonas amylolytica TaxID=83769 RepID=UPI0023A861E3